MKEYPTRETIGFPSTGNPEEDARILERILLHEKREIEGICPNGCAPLVIKSEHHLTCPRCGFNRFSNAPLEGVLLPEPSVAEMELALGTLTEIFYNGWTVRRCVDCSTPVAGGPTRCDACVQGGQGCDCF